MKLKLIALIGLIAIFSASLIHAAPSVSVQSMGTNPSGNRIWSVKIDPDDALFSNPADVPDRGMGGSLAVELAFSVSGTALVDANVENSVWIHANPGRNPFTGSVSHGLVVNGSGGAPIIALAATSPTPSNGGSGGLVGLPGDYNFDNIVAAADYPIWEDTLGSTTDLQANGDNTGASANRIDLADYNFWAANYGNVAAALAASGNSTNTIFAAFGSSFLTSGAPVEFLQIETLGVGPTTILWGGAPFAGGNIIAQAGLSFAIQNASASVPEPPSLALALVLGLGGAAIIRGRGLASFDRRGWLALWSIAIRRLS